MTPTLDHDELATFGDEFTDLQRDMLYIIAGSDGLSGNEIRNKIEAAWGKELSSARLYPNLDQLDEDGYIDKDFRGFDGRTHRYTIAEDGYELAREHADWCEHHLEECSIATKDDAEVA